MMKAASIRCHGNPEAVPRPAVREVLEGNEALRTSRGPEVELGLRARMNHKVPVVGTGRRNSWGDSMEFGIGVICVTRV